MKTIVIEALYGEYCNLYGDRGNLLYLENKLERAGVPYEVIGTHLYEQPAFVSREVDVLYLGPCTERQQEQILERLRPWRQALEKRMAANAITLFTGNALELLGEKIVCEDGRTLEGLALLHTTAHRFSNLRYNELCMGLCSEDKIVGYKNQLSHSSGETGEPFLTMQTGSGLQPGNPKEGFRRGGFIATYLLGPILPLNPQFTAKLLAQIAPETVFEPLPYEQEAYRLRLQELSDPTVNSKAH